VGLASTQLPYPTLGDDPPPTVGLYEEHHFDATGHLHLILRHLAYSNSNSDISKDTNLVAQRSLAE